MGPICNFMSPEIGGVCLARRGRVSYVRDRVYVRRQIGVRTEKLKGI